jgi:hypothetical protein
VNGNRRGSICEQNEQLSRMLVCQDEEEEEEEEDEADQQQLLKTAPADTSRCSSRNSAVGMNFRFLLSFKNLKLNLMLDSFHERLLHRQQTNFDLGGIISAIRKG